MANLTVRAAIPEDAGAIASILQEAFAEFRPLYTHRGFAATVVSADEVIARMSEGPVWVALWQNSICGTVAAVSRRDALYIRGMAVLPRARGKGVGEELLKEAEIYAAGQGLKKLLLTTTPFLRSAIRLYERCGFQKTASGPADLFGTPLFTMEKGWYCAKSRLNTGGSQGR